MRCPKCKSDNWKSASVIYNQRFTGVDPSAPGQHQTEFSKLAAPPKIPPMPEPLPSADLDGLAISLRYIFVGYIVYESFKLNIMAGILALAFLIKFWDKLANQQKSIRKDMEENYAREVKEHEQGTSAYQQWETAAVCLRCGKLFYPDMSGVSPLKSQNK